MQTTTVNILSHESPYSHPPCNYKVYWYLSEVPVNPHSFLQRLFAVVKARLSLCFADISYTAVVIVLVGLDATNVELTICTIVNNLKNTKQQKNLSNAHILGTTRQKKSLIQAENFQK